MNVSSLLFISVLYYPYLFFQNEVVNIKRMVKSSKRPISMRRVLSHFAPAGRALQV